MLVLCRRASESLQIGDEVTVTVLAVKGNQVRFGIAAPRDVNVDRQEVWARKVEQEGGGPAPQLSVPARQLSVPTEQRPARVRSRRKQQPTLQTPPAPEDESL
jgi:carbon storage regulator